MKRTFKPPAYGRHSSGQARCRVNGEVRYLGLYGSPQSYDAYAEILKDWQQSQDRAPSELTVRALIVLFMEHANHHYRTSRGEPTGETQNYRDAVRPVLSMYGSLPARQFSPLKLKAVREAMVSSGLTRATINGRIRRIKAVWSWAVSEELVRADVLNALKTVRGLQRGRSSAKESVRVDPVSDETVNATLPHLSKQVADAIRLQLLTGARPSEILKLRPMDIDSTSDVWQAVLTEHKNECRGKERVLFFGPRSRAILEPWMTGRAPDAYLFSPQEAEDCRRQRQALDRSTPMTPSQRKRHQDRMERKNERRRPAGSRYTAQSFRRAIQRACEAAGVELWSPGQLRHSRLTSVRREFGIEAASALAGHSQLQTTELYTEAAFERARQVMVETG